MNRLRVGRGRTVSGEDVVLIKSLRLALLVATLVASPHVAGEQQFWTLTGVQFKDGAVATGYLTWDDSTGRIPDWNIRVSRGQSSWPIAPFTYVPGNSRWVIYGAIYFASEFESLSNALAMDVYRDFQIQPRAPADGNNTVLPLNPVNGWERWVSGDAVPMFREMTAGTLVLTAMPPTTVVQVDEFYHPVLGHYFITANSAEKRDLDTGIHSGWTRTGESFKAYATGSRASGSINPVCRFYGSPQRGLDSHFYSADADECAQVFWKYGESTWQLEDDNVFQIDRPHKVTGACPDGTIPVYRLWNQRADSNHRYTTRAEIKAQMIEAGYRAEGYGPKEDVVMCALE